jgi:Domain of unknown function (DUF6542)
MASASADAPGRVCVNYAVRGLVAGTLKCQAGVMYVASWPWTAKAREDMRVDATVRHDTGDYTDDGWTETTHITAAGARGPAGARGADGWSAGAAAEEPAAAAQERGVAGWLAVVVLIGITGIGGLIDLLQGSAIRGAFNIALIVGSVVAILIVRRRSMFSVVVAPPLVYFVASAVVLYVRSGGLSNRSRLIDSAINWLVYGFPAIAGATGAVLIIAGIRMIRHR